MWTLRQRAQPVFRVTAAAVMSLWLMATVACSMHCAGLLRTATAGSGSCCILAASSPSASATGTSSRHHSPTGSPGTGGSGCLKEYFAGKPAGLVAPQAVIAPQTVLVEPPVAAPFLARFDEHPRHGSPALMLGRGLRPLAPPSRIA